MKSRYTKSRVVAAASRMVEQLTGFALVETSPGRVIETFERRAESLGYDDPFEYLEALREEPIDGEEPQNLINLLTNGLTAFWRDEPQLTALRSILQHLARQKAPDEAVHIWCAGVSTGEEAYTVAMIADEIDVQVQILGSDINTDFLHTARQGIYSGWSLRRLSECRRDAYLRPLGKDRWQVDHPAFDSISFQRHNLLTPPPHSSAPFGLWDIILCRNVLIYFTPSATSTVLRHMADSLSREGYLMFGSSEQIHPDKLGPNAPTLRPIQHGGGFLYRPSIETGKTIEPGRWLDAQNPPPTIPLIPKESGLEETTSDAGESQTVTTLLRQAWEHIQANEQELALANLEASLGYDPFRVESHCLMGSILHSLGADREALSAFQKALFLDPYHWFASYRLATLHAARGENDEARRAYRQTLKSLGRPENPFRGQILLQTMIGDLDELEILARRNAEDFLNS